MASTLTLKRLDLESSPINGTVDGDLVTFDLTSLGDYNEVTP